MKKKMHELYTRLKTDNIKFVQNTKYIYRNLKAALQVETDLPKRKRNYLRNSI